MRALLFVVAIVLVLLLVRVDDVSETGLDHDSTRVVATWGRAAPPYVIDSAMFTTTTIARARSAPTKHTTMRMASVGTAAVARPARWPTGCTTANSLDPGPCVPASRPCAIPAYICNRESGMTLNVWNHHGSGADGKYQAIPSSWNDYGGYLYAAWAPEEVQDRWAAELWNGGEGCQHWRAC